MSVNQPPRTLLRVKVEGGHHKVTFVELFFDLVFVFAITQLSHTLIVHFDLEHVLYTGFLLLAVWWVWIYTSWSTNWLDPERIPVRLMLLVLMVAGLFLSSSIPDAFGQDAIVFASAYAFMQVGRTAFVVYCVRHNKRLKHNFIRILAWLAMAGCFWIVGGLLEGRTRIILWITALAIEYLGPMVAFWVPVIGRSSTTDWDVEGAHMAERCGLFIIIALGESILVTGATFTGLEWTTVHVGSFVLSLLISFAMWWLYFDSSQSIGARAITKSADPGRIARLVYTYIHLIIVAGIIITAVAQEFVLAHPTGHAHVETVITVMGGPAVFILGTVCFKWAVFGKPPISSFVAIGILILGAILGQDLPGVALLGIAAMVMIGAAAWERWRLGDCPDPGFSGSH